MWAAAFLSPGGETAGAASFQVRACDAAPGAVNNSWQIVETMPSSATEARAVCPSSIPEPYGEVAQGLAVQDRLGAAETPSDGTFREWRITAPTAGSIQSAYITRDIGNRGTLQSGGFTPYGRSSLGDASTETCFAQAGEYFCRIQGATTVVQPAAWLAWGIRCAGTNTCGGGSSLHHVWVSIRSAIVTIEDPVDPLISEPTGELVEGAWLSGTRAVTFEGSDVTGIREVGVYRGQLKVAEKVAAGAAAGGCGQLNQGVAYTFTKPCEGSRGVNGPQTLNVDTSALPDGTNALRLVVGDAAGNDAEAALEVKVDNSPPAAPAVTTDGGWSTAADADWTWSVPAESDRAPIAEVEVERCLGSHGCAVEELPGTASSYEHLVPEGESTLRVRLVDAAGNVGAWSSPAPVRRDRTPPSVAIKAPAKVQPGEAVSADVTATDPHSGVAAVEQEVRANGGGWRTSQGPELFGANTVVRFRARARDHVGNVSAWQESADVRVEAPPAPQPTQTGPQAPTAAPTATPVPPARKRTVRLTNLKARRGDGRLTITGRVTPAAATGIVQAGKARTRVRRGRFVLRIRRVRATAMTATVRYLGDSAHRPAERRVRIPRRGG